jgi:hypothetical protein
MSPQPAQNSILASAFAAKVEAILQRMPLATTRHLTELDLNDCPMPSDVKDTRKWHKVFTQKVKKRVNRLVEIGAVMRQTVFMGNLFPVDGPFYISSLDGPPMDAAALARRLEQQRPVKYENQEQQTTHLYFHPRPRWAEPGMGGDELLQLFRQASFMSCKVLANYTSIYFHILKHEPNVAATFEFSLGRASDINIENLLIPEISHYFHYIIGSPECTSSVYIRRGSSPVRIIFFGRPIAAGMLEKIDAAFRERGELFELW